MIGFIIVAVVFGFLIRHENKGMNGSAGLMALITLGIYLVGYFSTMYVLIQFFGVRSMWVGNIANPLWLGLGYGAYRLIQARRDKAFYDRLNE
jgi:biotin transporter BioY